MNGIQSCKFMLLLELKETNISSTQNRLKNLNWQETHQLAIHNHEGGPELFTVIIFVNSSKLIAKSKSKDLNLGSA